MTAITRNRKPVSYLTKEEVREYIKMHSLTHHQFADRVGIGFTTATYYLNGYSPVPYNIAKLMYFFAQFGPATTGPADSRLMKNMHRTRTGQDLLMYMTPKELTACMTQLDIDRETLSDVLGYRSFRPVQNWLDGKACIKYCDAKLIQYFVEFGLDVAFEDVPVIDRIFEEMSGKRRYDRLFKQRELPECLQ